MAIRQAEPSEKKDRIKDKRLRKEFGIDLANHEQLRTEQGNKCRICGREFVKPPHVDHLHFSVRLTRSTLNISGWEAFAYNTPKRFHVGPCWGRTQVEAETVVRKAAMPLAIRALLCSQCNRGLGYMEDPRFFHGDTELLRAACDYLDNYPKASTSRRQHASAAICQMLLDVPNKLDKS